MKPQATDSNQSTGTQCHHDAATFAKVLDGRKQPIRGLWVRNDRYYAQLTFEDGTTGEKKVRRVALVDKDQNPVTTVPQAVEAMRKLMVKRSEDDLPVLHRTPKFKDFVKVYLDFIKAGQNTAQGQGAKKEKTILKEEYTLDGWIDAIGGVHVDKIKMAHINHYVAERLKKGVSRRTVKLDIIALRNVLKHARNEGWLKVLPMQGMDMKQFKTPQIKRPLFTAADLEKLCSAAMETRPDPKAKEDEEPRNVPVTKNAQQFVDYIRLLAYSGAREQEALALRWQDVDIERGQLTIGATGDTKNSTGRVVDFNPKLKAHLEDMATRLRPRLQMAVPLAATRGQGRSLQNVPRVAQAGSGARCEQRTRSIRKAAYGERGLPRHAPPLYLLRRDVGHRFHDNCSVGRAPGRGRSDREGLRTSGGRSQKGAGSTP